MSLMHLTTNAKTIIECLPRERSVGVLVYALTDSLQDHIRYCIPYGAQDSAVHGLTSVRLSRHGGRGHGANIV